MVTLYFCLDGSPSITRYWTSVPRIGDTISLPEWGGNLNPVRVYDVIWEGTTEPSACVYVHHAKIEHQINYGQGIGNDVHYDGYARR